VGLARKGAFDADSRQDLLRDVEREVKPLGIHEQGSDLSNTGDRSRGHLPEVVENLGRLQAEDLQPHGIVSPPWETEHIEETGCVRQGAEAPKDQAALPGRWPTTHEEGYKRADEPARIGVSRELCTNERRT